MNNDRQIIITVGNNRRTMNWQPQVLMLSEFYEKLRIPARSTESMQTYLELKKAEQDDLKDVGGFVAGELIGHRRKSNTVKGRDLITLDFDNIPSGNTDEILRRVEGLGCGYCVYSTRKHSPATPRLRIILPLNRTVTADEYEPLARYMATLIGIEFADPTTFEASRLMYFPSVCADGEYIFLYADKPMLYADELLKEIDKNWGDWHDVTCWAQVPGSENMYRRLAVKQSDPLTKSGVVGAFCRIYDIYRAMAEYLPSIYSPTATADRYTYSGGSTTGGAVVYQDGKFLYSHHASDPCCGKLVNAFDLVRLHKFSDLDNNVEPRTPTNRYPSYIAMCELAIKNKEVTTELLKERAASAINDFGGLDNGSEDLNWATALEINSQNNTIKPTIDNFRIIFENDVRLKGKFALNEFAGRGEVLGELPWSAFTKRRAWTDTDTCGMYWYLEKVYKTSHPPKIDNALALHSEKYKFNDVVAYLNSLVWDGTPRLDTLLTDYLGAVDTEYVRAVTRKAFTAAVKRAIEPGCKYDNMLILAGAQGLGKSTLLDKMSKGWFNDSIRTFEGKEASELLQGVWLVEISELDAFRKSDVARIKQFLSQRSDRFRAAYGRHVKEVPRCCVFFGTTNQTEFLRDETGNRRFWSVDVGINQPIKSVWKDLDDELDQIWAEAVMRYRLGEDLHLIGELEKTSEVVQEEHRESSIKEGVILEFLEIPVPADWARWSLDKRLVFLNGDNKGEYNLVKRDKICALEIWCEAFHGQAKDLTRAEVFEINNILRNQKGWIPANINFGYCGRQRGFRKDTLLEQIKLIEQTHS